ncbi:MAG: nicotinate phosphoribosyltransferase, partial [Clostridiales bacterium]|nr:nicotinate phosphoribosyltransferase [Clostridiales bacterium]
DLIALKGEKLKTPLTIVHPTERFMSTTFDDYEARPLQVRVFKDGRLVYDLPSLPEICAYHKREMASFWAEYKRPLNPHIYKVDLSEGLLRLKDKLLSQTK